MGPTLTLNSRFPRPVLHHLEPPPSRSHLLERYRLSFRRFLARWCYFSFIFHEPHTSWCSVRRIHVPYVREGDPYLLRSARRILFFTLHNVDLYFSCYWRRQIPPQLHSPLLDLFCPRGPESLLEAVICSSHFSCDLSSCLPLWLGEIPSASWR